jgi:cobalt-zinc-cadmium efflux system membrane fusion protein
MTKKTSSAILLAAGAFAFALLAACSGADHSADQMTSFSGKGDAADTAQLFTVRPDEMAHVQVVTVEPTSVQKTLRLTGAVAYNAFLTTPVISPVGGPVSRILVEPGQFVKKNQTLLEVSSPDFAQTRTLFLKAEDVYRVADKNYARAQDLYQHNAIAERDLLQAESDRIQARADLEAAEQTLRILGIPNPTDLSKLPVSSLIPLNAPIAGEVVERLVSPGQLLTAGATQAFTISDLSTVWVLANIYESDLAYVKTGDSVTITSDAYPEKFHGTISFVGPALDPTTRTAQARIVVDNPKKELRRDMFVNAEVAAGKLQNALLVPDASILRDTENMPFVYMLASKNAQGNQQFARRSVKIGDSQNGQTQILDGIRPGDRMAGDGSLFLQFANSLQK